MKGGFPFPQLIFILSLLAPVSLLAEARETKSPNQEGQVPLLQVQRTGRAALIPDISLIGSVAGAYFRDDPAGDQGENPSRTGFNFQGAELALQSVVDPYVRGDIYLLFHEEGVEIEEGILTTLSLPRNFQIRAGKLLARFGRQNTHHLEQLNFVDFSRTNRHFFGVEGFAEMGAEISLLFPVSWFSELSFELLQGENEGNFDGDRKGDLAYLGHLKNFFELTENLSLQGGLSGAFGFNDTAAGNLTQIYGTDLYFRWRPSATRGIKWQTEYILRRRETMAATQTEGGLYSQFVAQFARRWESGLRFEEIGIPQEGPRQWALSPVLTFLASEFFRIRAQYNLVRTASQPTQHEAFLQIQFNMGPHGAHTF